MLGHARDSVKRNFSALGTTFVHARKRQPAGCHPIGVKSLNTLLAITLAANLAACATPYAPQDFDFSGLNGLDSVALGTVESVRVVAVERDIHAFEESMELRLRPDLVDELVILLDNGPAVTLKAKGTQRFTAGQRVRVVSDAYSSHVEHE
jgi:outer membrane lipoprotein SlyB